MGIIANTVFKMTIAAVLGGPGFRRLVLAGLAVMGATLGATLLLTR